MRPNSGKSSGGPAKGSKNREKTVSITVNAHNAVMSEVTKGLGSLTSNVSYVIEKGSFFKFVLPDGTILSFEQTADDFSITKSVNDEELVCYSQPTSDEAKQSDGADGVREFVTGKG